MMIPPRLHSRRRPLRPRTLLPLLPLLPLFDAAFPSKRSRFLLIPNEMGGTQSKTTVSSLTDIAMEVAQTNIARCVQAATQEQIIAVSKVAGDVTISGTTMSQTMSVNMSCALSNEMDSKIKGDIADEFAQYASTKGIAALSALGRTQAIAATNIEQIFSAKSSQSNLQEAVMQNLQRQKISATSIGGNLVITNTSMEQTAEVIAKAIISSTGYADTIATVANKIDQEGEAEEKGPFDTLFETIKGVVSSYIFMIIGIVVIAGLVVIFFLKYLFTTETGALLVEKGADIAKQGIAARS